MLGNKNVPFWDIFFYRTTFQMVFLIPSNRLFLPMCPGHDGRCAGGLPLFWYQRLHAGLGNCDRMCLSTDTNRMHSLQSYLWHGFQMHCGQYVRNPGFQSTNCVRRRSLAYMMRLCRRWHVSIHCSNERLCTECMGRCDLRNW